MKGVKQSRPVPLVFCSPKLPMTTMPFSIVRRTTYIFFSNSLQLLHCLIIYIDEYHGLQRDVAYSLSAIFCNALAYCHALLKITTRTSLIDDALCDVRHRLPQIWYNSPRPTYLLADWSCYATLFLPLVPFPRPHPYHLSKLNFNSEIWNFTVQISAYQEGAKVNIEVTERGLRNLGM